MPYSAEINDFYWDFGNGYVPFFAVIGAYNILMYGENSVTGATGTVPAAIESFNAMGVVGPIEDFSKNFWGYEYIDVSGVFAHPDLLPITVSIQENSNPEVVNTTLDGDILLVTINPVMGNSNVTLIGEAGGDSAEHTFTVTSANPNTITVDYPLEDSPDQGLYPNNPNPYSNSYTDLGWTDLSVVDDEDIASLHFSLDWESVDYASEGTLRATSPANTDVLLYSSTSTTPVNLQLDVSNFNGENAMGDWIVYMVDSFGDGGHQVTNGVVTFGFETTEIGTAFGFVSGNGRDPIEGAVITAGNISTLSDEAGIFTFDIVSGTYEFTCEIDGFETLTIEEDITTGETTVINFDYTGSEGIVPQIETELVGNYPNPFNPVTNISYSVKELGEVSIQIFNTKGQLVKTLVNETKDTGSYSTIWNGNDDDNKAVSSGIYFYKMKTGDKYTSTKKMILLK